MNPKIVDLITFCTKNPIPVLRNTELMETLKQYSQFWQVSLTPYGREIEPNVPAKADVADAIVELGKILGPEKVLENMKKHNPKSPLLIGELNEDDKISYKEQKSWIIDEQLELF